MNKNLKNVRVKVGPILLVFFSEKITPVDLHVAGQPPLCGPSANRFESNDSFKISSKNSLRMRTWRECLAISQTAIRLCWYVLNGNTVGLNIGSDSDLSSRGCGRETILQETIYAMTRGTITEGMMSRHSRQLKKKTSVRNFPEHIFICRESV